MLNTKTVLEQIVNIISGVSESCGNKLINNKDYEIKERGSYPHSRPSEKNEKIPFGACYIFYIDKNVKPEIKNPYGIIKIGKVSAGGKARFFSNHYYYTEKGPQSTLCKSLSDSGYYSEINSSDGLTVEERARKITEITGRIDIIFKTEAAYANTLIEAALLYKFGAEFEKTRKF